ncbi:MAG: putative subtilase-type serine protease precursor [Phycisphaerales bacterium]|nr:putative subtilase-type serine protease precursor [Phycisphaerales bacterium]
MKQKRFPAIVVLALLALPALAQRGPAPDPLPFSVPFAATIGTVTDVDFHVSAKSAPGFWATFPVTADPTPAKDADVARLRLTVSPAAPVGIGALRFMTATGVSSLRLFFIDDIPTTARADNNTTPKNAQPLTLPAAIETDAQPLANHYYRFAARKGQRVAFEVIAQRLNSRADPIVRLLDSSGQELAYCDDTPGLGADLRFAHTFAAAGEYLLELRDANYEGGSEYRYRLRVGDFPAVTVAFPLAGKRGSQTTFTFEGPGGDRFDSQSVMLNPSAARQTVPLKLPGGRASGFVSVHADSNEDFVATKPHHSQATAARVTLPVNISGRITEPGARDFYRLSAKKGDHLSLRARTRSLGSPAMMSLQILNSDSGTRLAESKFARPEPKGGDATPIPDDEGSLDFTIPKDGDYDIVAQDLTGAAGPAAVYRLEGQIMLPDFTLSVDNEKIDGAAGTTVRIKVKATRRDFDGPITLALAGDAAEYILKNETILKGKLETDLEITLPKKLSPHQPLTFTIEGRATAAAGREIVHTATTIAALKKLFPRLADPPPELNALIGLGIRPPEKTASTQPTTKPTVAP